MAKRTATKGYRKYNAKKITIGGIEFDSQTEALYYQELRRNKLVSKIELQPVYQIINPYKVTCKRCGGNGSTLNTKTSNYNKCQLCKGAGTRSKAGAIYTADFKVTYVDGHVEVLDVKGGPVSKDFPLRKKLFELNTGMELIVVRMDDRKGWIRK